MILKSELRYGIPNFSSACKRLNRNLVSENIFEHMNKIEAIRHLWKYSAIEGIKYGISGCLKHLQSFSILQFILV